MEKYNPNKHNYIADDGTPYGMFGSSCRRIPDPTVPHLNGHTDVIFPYVKSKNGYIDPNSHEYEGYPLSFSEKLKIYNRVFTLWNKLSKSHEELERMFRDQCEELLNKKYSGMDHHVDRQSKLKIA